MANHNRVSQPARTGKPKTSLNFRSLFDMLPSSKTKLKRTKKSTTVHRTEHDPEPERLKITGVRNWEDAVGIAARKPKLAGGWPR